MVRRSGQDPTLARLLCEIDELAKLDAITEGERKKARRIAQKAWQDWTALKCSEMVDLAISLARIS